MSAQLFLNGLIASCGYAMMALGFGLIYSTTRIFHIAHGATYVLTAYSFYAFNVLWHMPSLAAGACALLVAAGSGMLIDELLYRPLRKHGASLLVLLLSSLGLYIFAINAIALIFGSENKAIVTGVQPSYTLGNAVVTNVQLVIVASFLAIGMLVLVLRKTSTGKLIRALRDDEDLLSATGTNPQKVRRVVFAVGSACSGLAAVLLAIDVGIDPQIGLRAVLIGAVAVVIGGMAYFEGAVVGALVLGLLETIMIWHFSARWSTAATFVTLILFLLYRPEGLLGRRRRVEEAAI